MSKSYVDSIIDSMQHAVWVVELDPRSPRDASFARIIHANPVAASLFHCTCGSLIGSSLVGLAPPVAADGRDWWETVVSGHDVSGVELDLLGPNRLEVPVMLAASALPQLQGESRHVICIAQDMTQRRFAEHLVRENDRLVDEIAALRHTLRGPLPGSALDAE